MISQPAQWRLQILSCLAAQVLRLTSVLLSVHSLLHSMVVDSCQQMNYQLDSVAATVPKKKTTQSTGNYSSLFPLNYKKTTVLVTLTCIHSMFAGMLQTSGFRQRSCCSYWQKEEWSREFWTLQDTCALIWENFAVRWLDVIPSLHLAWLKCEWK